MPKHVVERHNEEIYKVMSELAGVLVELDGSSWSRSHCKCVEHTYASIKGLNFEHGYLGSKLRALGRTLFFPYRLENLLNTDPELQSPLHSC